jgi:hypothetical protein
VFTLQDVSRRRRSGLFVIALTLCITLAVIPAAGCGEASSTGGSGGDGGESGNNIPLQTLAEGMNSDYGRIDEMPIPEDAPPECLAISDEEEFQRLLSLAYFQEPIAEVDFERYIVIAAMQGPKNTAGYSISVKRAVQDGTEVIVEINVVEPEPGATVAQVLTSPYHLVLAERSAFDLRGELTFTFDDQNGDRISQLFTEV